MFSSDWRNHLWLERIAMYLQNVDNVYDLIWTESPKKFYDIWRRLPS